MGDVDLNATNVPCNNSHLWHHQLPSIIPIPSSIFYHFDHQFLNSTKSSPINGSFSTNSTPPHRRIQLNMASTTSTRFWFEPFWINCFFFQYQFLKFIWIQFTWGHFKILYIIPIPSTASHLNFFLIPNQTTIPSCPHHLCIAHLPSILSQNF